MRHEMLQKKATADVKERLAAGQDPYPFVVEIHPTNRCNHRCRLCFHAGVAAAQRAELGWERYQELFAELQELGMRHISISGGGEPFLHERTADLLHEIARRGLRARVVTNGSMLGEREIGALLAADEVRISLDAIRPATYAALRGINGGMLESVLRNMSALAARRNSSGAALSIGATLLLNELNQEEVTEFCTAVLARGADTAVIKYDVYGRSPGAVEKLRQQLQDTFGGRVEFREALCMSVSGRPCFIPHFKVALDPHGTLYACCLASQPGEENGYALGDIGAQSFADVWRQSRELRRRMQAGVACRHCNHTDYLLNIEMAQQ